LILGVELRRAVGLPEAIALAVADPVVERLLAPFDLDIDVRVFLTRH
jgi:hypothetical protein